jgi:hypothetical protein
MARGIAPQSLLESPCARWHTISPMREKMTVKRCREILGVVAEPMSDAEVEAERDHMELLAHAIFDQFAAERKRDPERMRWLLHAHETGEAE